VGFLIHNIEIQKNNMEFDCPYLQYKVKLNSEAQEILNFFTTIVWNNIIISSHNQEIIQKGQNIICNLFEVLVNNKELLPKGTKIKYENAENKYRVICDYISGMTDRYAVNMFSKINLNDN
jgi:dGTPase